LSTDLLAAPDLAAPRAAREARPSRAKFRPFHLWFYLLMGGMSFSAIGAFVWVINNSLKTNRDFLGTSPFSVTTTWSFENYANAWESANVAAFFGNSVLVSVRSTALGVVLSVFAAYPIARIAFRGSGALMTVFTMGLMVPWMVTFIPLYLTMRDLGLLDSQLGLILVYATYNLPFNVFVLVGFMRTLPVELEEAGAIDGASPSRTFFSIVLPLLSPGISSVTIISFLSNWNEFFYALVFVHSKEKMTLPLGLFQLGQSAEYAANWTTLFAGLMITVIPVLLIFALLQKRITAGLTAGALKG
jgi:ABC-type glycerol-3-phosphate transport system permease component